MRLLGVLRNGWLQRTRPTSLLSKHGLAKPDAAALNPQMLPSVTRAAFLASLFKKTKWNASTPTDPVQMTSKMDKRNGRVAALRSRLTFGRQFLKEVAHTATAKNEVTLSQRLTSVIAEYGKVAVLFHASVMGMTTSTFYLGLMAGVDMQRIIDLIPGGVDPSAGTLLVAFLLAESTAPLRTALTIVTAPMLGERLRGTAFGNLLGLRRARDLRLSYLPGRGATHIYLKPPPADPPLP